MNQYLQANRHKRKVLVVDDELVNRELLTAILSMNYNVDCASNGKEALDILRTAQDKYSLILLDLLMPLVSGFEVIEACKADAKLKEIPIIVMTSEKSAEVRSIRMGADDFIAKPYRMPEVIIARCERIIELNEEKALIRSIEKDPLTGLYIKLFFDAYISRRFSNMRGYMDALMIRLEGAEPGDEVLKMIAKMIDDAQMNSKGIACRADNNIFCVYCRHRENYEELFDQMQRELPDGIRLKVGVCVKVDKTAPAESWFEKAGSACGSVADGKTVCYAE